MPRSKKCKEGYEYLNSLKRLEVRIRKAECVCLICDKGGKNVQINEEEINTFLIKDMLGTPSGIIESLGENVYKAVWLCSKCKLLVEDARTMYSDAGTMMLDDEGISQLHNNFRVFREQISEMMRKSWKDSKKSKKNLTYMLRRVLVRSLFEKDVDIDMKRVLNLLEGGSQGKPEVNEERKKCEQHQDGRPKKKVCPICGKSFRGLQEHIRVVHFCPSCDQHFPTHNEKMIHVNTVHKGLPIYECPQPDCRKAFGLKSLWEKHQVTHKPFICKRCGERFRSKGALEIHGGSSCNDNPEEKS